MRWYDLTAMHKALKEGRVFRVFRKFGVDDYKDIGMHKIIKYDEGTDERSRESHIFYVEPVLKK